MRNAAFASVLVFGLVVLILTEPAFAVIKVGTSMRQVYGASTQIIHGEVTKVDTARRLVHLKVVDTITPRKIMTSSGLGYATPPTGPLTVAIQEPADLVKRVEVGGSALLFVGRRGIAVHLADTWLAAEGADPKALKVIAQLDLGLTFPGCTKALVKVLAQMRSGKALDRRKVNPASAAEMAELGWPLMDWFEHSNWGQAFDLGDTGVTNGTAMAAADATGDGKADLVIVAGGKARFFLGTGPKSAFREVTAEWGLAGAGAQKPAFGDVNGDRKADLLLDGLWINTGSKLVPSKAGFSLKGRPVLAAALEDATGDGKRDAVTLLTDGSLLVYENPAEATWRGGSSRGRPCGRAAKRPSRRTSATGATPGSCTSWSFGQAKSRATPCTPTAARPRASLVSPVGAWTGWPRRVSARRISRSGASPPRLRSTRTAATDVSICASTRPRGGAGTGTSF